jgi:hypothetical protein
MAGRVRLKPGLPHESPGALGADAMEPGVRAYPVTVLRDAIRTDIRTPEIQPDSRKTVLADCGAHGNRQLHHLPCVQNRVLLASAVIQDGGCSLPLAFRKDVRRRIEGNECAGALPEMPGPGSKYFAIVATSSSASFALSAL